MQTAQSHTSELLDRLNAWAGEQENLQLILGPALSDREIDKIPSLIKRTDIPDRYSPDEFRIPDSYRAFLRICSFARLGGLDGEREWIYPLFHIYSPGELAEARAWTPADEYCEDEREVSTTEFIAFADGGLGIERNYWCFYTGQTKGTELPIYFLDNDHELLIAKYLNSDGSREWLDPKYKEPSFLDFGTWLERLVDWTVKEPFDESRERNTW